MTMLQKKPDNLIHNMVLHRPWAMLKCFKQNHSHDDIVIFRITFSGEFFLMLYCSVGRICRASDSELVDMGSIPSRIEPRTIKSLC